MPALALSVVEEPPVDDFVGGTGAARVQTVDTVQALQARIDSLQRTRLDTRLLPTHEALADLLPAGGLQEGAVYTLSPSSALTMALLAGPSAAGAWCGVVGMPEFGIEAAETMGIDLDRLVLVPHPGDQWLTVTAAIADALSVIAVRPGRAASDGAIAKLAGRVRERGSTLLVTGAWPQAEAMISISGSRWSGLGDGHGYLSEREVTITVSSRRSPRPRSGRLLLPDGELGIRRLDRGNATQHGDATQRAQDRWSSPGTLRAG